jgi:phage terminase large subunit-like protein
MLRIDREKIGSLPAAQQQDAARLLEVLEAKYAENPLLGYEPHPKQKIFHSSVLPLKAFLGGNRSGKTTAGILDDLIQCVDEDCLPEHLRSYKKFDPPTHVRIVAPDFTSTMEGVIFQKLREWAPKSQLRGGRFDKAYDKSLRKLSFQNGSTIDFLTFEQDLDKFGGAAKHRIHYDEEPPSNIRKEGLMRLIDYGGDELFTMTPLHGMSWMFDEIWEPWTKRKLEDGIVVLVDMDDNPYLDEVTKIRVLKGLSKEERDARKSGRFVHFAGMIYDDFSRNMHVIPEIREVPPGSRIYVGIDPGMRHMAAVVWTYLTTEDTLVVFDELALEKYNVKQTCDAIKLINAKWGQKAPNGSIISLQPDQYVIDPSARNIVHQTGRSDQMEYTDQGIFTILGQNSVTAGISAVKVRLEAHRLLVTANCQSLIDEFRKYRWATPTRTEDDAKEKPVKTDDHLLDALRYVVASRPYTSPEEQGWVPQNEFDLRMKEEMTGKSYKRRTIPSTPMGGVYA